MAVNYAYEKLSQAASSMATSPAPLHERILGAMITCSTLSRDDFDPDLQNRWQEIVNRLTAEEPVGDEGSFKATINAMSEKELVLIAHKIVSLEDDVRTRTYER